MDIKIDPSIMKEDVIVAATDSSDIKVANRGENGEERSGMQGDSSRSILWIRKAKK